MVRSSARHACRATSLQTTCLVTSAHAPPLSPDDVSEQRSLHSFVRDFFVDARVRVWPHNNARQSELART
eukprot:803607-Pleurochrysis_carterae.AAC.1